MRLTIACLVGVALSASMARSDEWIATRTIPAGALVAAGDIASSDERGGAAHIAMTTLVGQETKRTIFAGQPVRADDLGPPTLVRRNDLVSMHYLGQSLKITADGRALESGGAGERIRILNLDSRIPVIGKVVRPGTVEVRR